MPRFMLVRIPEGSLRARVLTWAGAAIQRGVRRGVGRLRWFELTARVRQRPTEG
jgi:hypothetical protein